MTQASLDPDFMAVSRLLEEIEALRQTFVQSPQGSLDGELAAYNAGLAMAWPTLRDTLRSLLSSREGVRAAVVEECARVAKAHVGSAAQERRARGLKLGRFSPEAQEILAEERGEDIAGGVIETAIRSLADVPAGMVCVPVEPSDAAIEAICAAHASSGEWPKGYGVTAQLLRRESARRGYIAALIAAQSPNTEKPNG